MKVFLLAAGYATRMYPLTRNQPKPLLEVAGAPILSHMLERVLELPHVSEVVVITNSRFQDSIRGWAVAHAGRVPIRVLDDGSTSDDDKLGAVGDLGFALEQVPLDGEDWLVAAGDNLLEFSLVPLHAVFESTGCPLLAVRTVSRDGPSPYNETTVAADGRVTRFREKPPDPGSDLAAIALYLFPAHVASLLARYLADGGNRDAPGHFIAWLVGETEVYAEHIAGAWFDIGSLSGLATARERFRPPAVDGADAAED